MKVRADQLVKSKGWCASRTKAQALIAAGHVEYNDSRQRLGWQLVPDAATLLDAEFTEIRLRDTELTKYVSRGGLKLAAALTRLELQVSGMRVLDVGISTGGFADCLLQNGAGQVVGIDVGHGQLHEKLKKHPQVQLFDGLNAREIKESGLAAAALRDPFDLIVMDLSFISVTQVLAGLLPYLRDQGAFLILVKPQFELNRAALNKKGVVKSAELREQALHKVKSYLTQLNLCVLADFPCAIRGQNGNQEYFIYARK